MASMSEKETASRQITTNATVKLDIDGKTLFTPPTGGAWRELALYANVDLPAPGSVAREALARGGWRAWFQEKSSTEADGRDETGYIGPVAIPRFGDLNLLISHSWPHTVDTSPWEFCIKVYSYDSTGKAVDFPLTMTTREVKIVEH